jgi:endonuclease/exonuclease/phosphatase family metal-dependent hydrolase
LPAAEATDTARTQSARVGTFNIHKTTATRNDLPSWTYRRDAVVASIKRADPDVVAIQEGAGWVGGKCHLRQVDDLANRLGGGWTVAHTDPLPCRERGWRRTGVYVLYDASVYRAVGASGHWDIGTDRISQPRWAAYQELEKRSSGARMLFVSTHLTVGRTLSLDKERAAETRNLLAAVARLRLGLPVVYAGDYNSHERHDYDGPGVVMRNAGMHDARYVADRRVHWPYDSANGYLRRPPAAGVSIDHIYASPGVTLRTWHLVMRIRDGRFVGVIPSDHNLLVSDIAYRY